MNRLILISSFLLFAGARVAYCQESGEVAFTFETGDLQGWKIVEGEFDYFVSDRPMFHNAPSTPYNKEGKYYLSTVEQQPGQPSNDRMTGIAESPVFTLTGPKMSMLVGAGVQRNAYVALCTLDGKEVLRAQGNVNTEVMKRVEWNAPELVGQKVFLRLVDRETGSWGYVALDDFHAEGTIDLEATRQWENRLKMRRMNETLKKCNLPGLRTAIEYLCETYGDRYPKGKQFLETLDRLERELPDVQVDGAEAMQAAIESLRFEALTANPLLAEQPIVFISRPQYLYGNHHAIDTHQHTDENNTDKFRGGGALKVIDFGSGGEVRTLVEPQGGMVREPEIYFDATKILFSMRRNIGEDFHIWEIEVDPNHVMEQGCSAPRQLTSLAEVSDIDPIYLPSDQIVFTSTRERKYNMCSRDVGANLFRMEADGANITQITKNTLYDNHATLLPDGRIMYARWEYVDRNFGDAHGLWTVNPDGTGQAIFWGNNTASPGAVFNARMIPGTNQFICIFGPHHDYLWGSLAIVDRSLGMDVDREHRESVVKIWPEEHRDVLGQGNWDTFGMGLKVHYCDPYPLSDKFFLCSKGTGRGVQMGLYLVDMFGNELLLHTEGNSPQGCYNPMPLRPRRRPPVLPTRRDYQSNNGVVFMQDVYQGTHMDGVRRGSIKYLRVVESPPKRSWCWGSWQGQGYQAPGMNWHDFSAKRILGTVPVEPDGSAYFEVPCDKFIYFQALDKDMMMVQSMRSGTILQSGETVSCVGCHEDRLQPPPTASTLARQRAPSKLEDWYGPVRSFSYAKEVQPVFDKHCVRCHDFDKEAGKTLVLAGDTNPYFNASYVDLWLFGRKRIKCIGGGPAAIQQAYSWGSHPSMISHLIRPMSEEEVAQLPQRISELREKHQKELKLGREDLERIHTWLDLNAPYYPEYLTAYPDSQSGRSPLDGSQLDRLERLTKVPFRYLRLSDRRNIGPQVSFERPELSPCLKGLAKDSPEYDEALAIIQAGAAQLKAHPRCDMEGFVPCETDQRRLKRYDWLETVERRYRDAIAEGQKLYDRDIDAWEYSAKP